MKFVPFRAEHLQQIEIQPAQKEIGPFLTVEVGRALETEWAWSGVRGGAVLASGGVLPIWPGRATAWAILSEDVTPGQFVWLHRRVRMELDRAAMSGFRRIETEADPRFPGDRAIRWLELLGFESEGLMRGFMPDGSDMMRMVRLR